MPLRHMLFRSLFHIINKFQIIRPVLVTVSKILSPPPPPCQNEKKNLKPEVKVIVTNRFFRLERLTI